MTHKIMLVEDDNNLRAIYADRLMAEGYEIVSARDGEEALAMAVKEKPSLIISDVMMPKISGFDMLDILRTTPETKDVKVIMMTALSQAEDKARADKLGADKYLVKSQVTLEDVARVVHEVLGDSTEAVEATSEEPATEPVLASPAVETPEPVMSAPAVANTAPAEPATVVAPAATAVPQAAPNPFETPMPSASTPASTLPTEPIMQTPQPTPETPVAQTQPMPAPVPEPSLSQPDFTMPSAPTSTSTAMTSDNTSSSLPPMNTSTFTPPLTDTSVPSSDTAVDTNLAPSTDPTGGVKKVIEPISDPSTLAQPKIYELYEKEMAEEAKLAQQPAVSPDQTMPTSQPSPVAEPTATEPVIQPNPAAQTPSSSDPSSFAL